jgi:hypothetical protein
VNEYVVPSTNRIKTRTTALRAAGPGELVTWLKDGIGDICRSAINLQISPGCCALAMVRSVPPDTACPARFRRARAGIFTVLPPATDFTQINSPSGFMSSTSDISCQIL